MLHTIYTFVSSEYRAELYTRLENRRIKQLVQRNRKANEKESGRQPLKERKVCNITDSTLKARKEKKDTRTSLTLSLSVGRVTRRFVQCGDNAKAANRETAITTDTHFQLQKLEIPLS